MNIQRWKGFVWFGSLAVGGFLAYYVYDFLQQKEELAREISDESLQSVFGSIEKPPEQRTDVIDYDSVQAIFHGHDWTGKKPPEVKPQQVAQVEQVKPKVPIADLLKVLAIKVDTSKPLESVAYVKFTDPKLAVHTEREDTILRPEEHLFAPYDDVRVEAITGAGVVFAFDDSERESETVPASPYTSQQNENLGIVVVGPGGAIMPQLQRQIGNAAADLAPHSPEELTQVRRNEYQVGTETLRKLNEDYSLILSRDISFSTYKNPRTGMVEGIKINRVAAGSIPAQAGVTEGEVLKSINGHRVKSPNDAIAYVKANSNGVDKWVAVFEKQGREFTRTYYSPNR